MLTTGIWCLGVSLEALLILRGFQEKLVQRYPIFYSYLIFVLAQDFLRIAILRWLPSQYWGTYWATQFLGFIFGSAVIFEIYQVALRAFPGAAKMARNLLLLLFGTVFTSALLTPSRGVSSWVEHTFEILERQLRLVQALALFALIILFLWYAIPFGKNLRGILLGYGAFLLASVFQFTMLARFWSALWRYWLYVQPVTYVAVLSWWMWNLSAEHPVPADALELQLEEDYMSLVGHTFRKLQKLRSHLRWTAVP